MYTYQEVKTFIEEEDVKFIRLAFCDVSGRQKNISISPDELDRAFADGIAIDASAVKSFGDECGRDLFLRPDPATLSVLPWRPASGRVVRMFCALYEADGTPFVRDCRAILQNAVREAETMDIHCKFSTETEFYLFTTDENGDSTGKPFDNAGYMDIAPEDKGENVRREICFSLQNMSIPSESSHHEEGPGQNEIDFCAGTPLRAADNAVTFLSVVKTIAKGNGLYADFSPKPLSGRPGSGMQVHIAVNRERDAFIAGILKHIRDITFFLNPTPDSYKRLGGYKAPRAIAWGIQNRTALIRVPAADSLDFEVRSPDASGNIYLYFALLIYAGLDGVKNRLAPPAPRSDNLFEANDAPLLPENLEAAKACALQSEFVRRILPESFLSLYR